MGCEFSCFSVAQGRPVCLPPLGKEHHMCTDVWPRYAHWAWNHSQGRKNKKMTKILRRHTDESCKHCFTSSLPCKTSAIYFQLSNNITNICCLYKHVEMIMTTTLSCGYIQRSKGKLDVSIGSYSVVFLVSHREGIYADTISTTNPIRTAKGHHHPFPSLVGLFFKSGVAWTLIRA